MSQWGSSSPIVPNSPTSYIPIHLPFSSSNWGRRINRSKEDSTDVILFDEVIAVISVGLQGVVLQLEIWRSLQTLCMYYLGVKSQKLGFLWICWSNWLRQDQKRVIRLDPQTLAKSLVVKAQTWNMGSTPAMGTNWSIHVYHLINLPIVLVVLILNSTAFTDSEHGWAWDIIWFGFRRSHMTQDGPNAVRQGMIGYLILEGGLICMNYGTVT